MIKGTEKQLTQLWEEFRDNILASTPININENAAEQKKRIAYLEANPEKWFAYYFPKYAYAHPAPFHIKATKRLINNPEWYEVRAWSRELAKSTRTMMEIIYLTLTGKKSYMLMISNSWDNAVRLLMPYKANLEFNQRIINDYGKQEKYGSWTDGEFTTKGGVSFRAVGAGQSPRGTRKEEKRPDIIAFDDLDTDEECRNEELIDKKWKWVEEAAIATRSISNPTLIIFCGNIIAEDCCITRAIGYADHTDIINIRDKNGKSTWEYKNSEEHIDRVLSKVSWEAQQKEYFNNPVTNGKTFPEMTYGKCPRLKELDFIVVYADPATSNKDKPSIKSGNQTSTKCVQVIGYKDLKYYVYKVWLNHVKNSTFVDWLYASRDYIGGKTQGYYFIENNTLQDPFYEQVLLPLIFEKGRERKDILGITPDERQKPDKWVRIEGTLEPLNRLGLLVLNIDEKEDPHMKRLEAQFKGAKATAKIMDGPDCTEGGVHIIKNKVALLTHDSGIQTFGRPQNNKGF